MTLPSGQAWDVVPEWPVRAIFRGCYFLMYTYIWELCWKRSDGLIVFFLFSTRRERHAQDSLSGILCALCDYPINNQIDRFYSLVCEMLNKS